jgi:hypothetical protein
MRATRSLPLIALGLVMACRSGSTVPEPGAVLLQLGCADGATAPDELRVWAYDDRGRLWDGARIPEHGALDATNPAKLGTILVAPGAIQGALRLHIRAFAAGVRLADGMLTIPSLDEAHRTYDLRLDSALPADSDGDDVPDAIDDCAGVANPGQGGCSAAPLADAGGPADGAPKPTDGGANAADAGDSARDATGSGSGKDIARAPDEDAGADAGAVVVADAEIQTSDGRDAPVDAPFIEEADTNQNTVDVRLQGTPDGSADKEDASDAGLFVDLAANQDTGSDLAPDFAIPVDTTVALDAVPATDDAYGGETQAELCSRDDECASTFCADGVCCSNACGGPCRSCNQPSSSGLCHGYTAGTDPESECPDGTTCNGVGACGTAPSHDKANGQLCETGAECTSGNCRDNVCCNEACTLPCQSCGTGTCLPIEKADDIPECTGNMTCNAKSKCVARGS